MFNDRQQLHPTWPYLAARTSMKAVLRFLKSLFSASPGPDVPHRPSTSDEVEREVKKNRDSRGPGL